MGHNSTGLHPHPKNLQSRQETDKGRAGRARETFRGQDWAQTWPGTDCSNSKRFRGQGGSVAGRQRGVSIPEAWS